MYTAELKLTIRGGDENREVSSVLAVAASQLPDLMEMVSSMLVAHTDKLVKDVEPRLGALSVEAVQESDEPEKYAPPNAPAQTAYSDCLREIAGKRKKKQDSAAQNGKGAAQEP